MPERTYGLARMATTATLQDLAKRHLWLHFSRMGAYQDGADIPIIVRGDGCHVWDEQATGTSTA